MVPMAIDHVLYNTIKTHFDFFLDMDTQGIYQKSEPMAQIVIFGLFVTYKYRCEEGCHCEPGFTDKETD